MKSINIISVCVALLLTIVIPNGVAGETLADLVEKIAQKNRTIDTRFKPFKNGSLGEDNVCLRYKGLLLLNDKKVVMTFTNIKYEHVAKNEYEMSTYLNAINNPDVEIHGIPTVYYYGTWKNGSVIMMATTIYDSERQGRFEFGEKNPLDLMILCRDYVKTAKYIHSRGVYTNNIYRITFNKHQFQIRYFVSAIHLSKSSRQIKIFSAYGDFMKFFWEMKVNHGFVDVLTKDFEELNEKSGLGRVKIAFSKYLSSQNEHYFNSETRPYDELYRIIVKEIQLCEQENKRPAIYSWISGEEERRAAEEASKNGTSIADIKDPFGTDEILHDKVDFDFFDKIYNLKKNHSQSHQHRQRKIKRP